MTPTAYLAAFPRSRRLGERKRLAAIAGCSVHTMRAYTEANKDGLPRRRCQDAETCLKLEKATRGMVTAAEWNPAFAPLIAG